MAAVICINNFLRRKKMRTTKLFMILAAMIGVSLIGLTFVWSTNTTAKSASFAERGFVENLPDGGTDGAYNFDKAHCFINFKVKHFGLIEVQGFFRDVTGTINYDSKDVTKSSVTFTAKVASVDTGVAPRDNDLRSKNFFEVETYPDMTFKSTKIVKKGKNLSITGDFTLKGVTKQITFPFQIAGFAKDPWGGNRIGVMAETLINRRDYGINYNEKLASGVLGVGDEVKISLQIEAVLQQPPAAK
jgi:polyisoprenoid-binding protein YceI